MAILRIVASLTLGLVILAGLLCYLLLVNISQRLDDSEMYKDAINDTNAYNRIYDEVLVDEAFTEQNLDLLGGVGLDAQESIEVLRDVMPPAYLQEQTEANIDRFTGFLSHDLERLDLYLELREPLGRVEAVVLDKTEQVITEIEIEEPSTATTECTADSLQSLADDLASEFAGLSAGQLPESVPSLEILDEECRRQEFDNWIDQVANNPRIDSETARIIEDEKDDLRQSFIEGDTSAFLDKAAAPLVSSVVDDSLEEIRQDLQENDRLDLLQNLADSDDDLSREDIDELADYLRIIVVTVNGPVKLTALLLVIVGCVLLAAVHFPRPRAMLLWPGLSLVFGGGVCLIMGFVLNSVIPVGIGNVLADPASYSPDVSIAAIGLAGDLFESFARQVTAGIIPAAVAVTVMGGVLVVASLFADVLWPAIRRLLPASGDEGSR